MGSILSVSCKVCVFILLPAGELVDGLKLNTLGIESGLLDFGVAPKPASAQALACAIIFSFGRYVFVMSCFLCDFFPQVAVTNCGFLMFPN